MIGSVVMIMELLKEKTCMNIKNCIAMTLVFMVVTIGAVNAATITVDDEPDSDYTSIQSAVNNANDGDTILIYLGTYVENVDDY